MNGRAKGKKLYGIDDTDLVFLYREILLYWERSSHKSFRITKGPLKQYLRQSDIQVGFEKKSKMLGLSTTPSKNRKQYINLYHDESSQAASLIKRLRNAVAHGNVALKKIAGISFYIFTDWDREGLCTMIAKVNQKNLRPFVRHLISTEN